MASSDMTAHVARPGSAGRGSALESERGVIARPGSAGRGSAPESERGVIAQPASERGVIDELYRAIYAVVRRIPRGQVATYGQVAELAGIPGGARVAGAAMKVSKPSDRLPWQRVLGKASRTRGRIAIHDPVGAAVQRQLLGKEGVEIGDTGLVPLDRFGWLPLGASGRRARATATAGSGRAAPPRRRPRSAWKSRASSSRR